MTTLNKHGRWDNTWIEDDPAKSRKAVLQCKYYVDGKVAVEIDFTNKKMQKKNT